MQLNQKDNVNSIQKCWYCKRNPADNIYLNINEVNKDRVEIKGATKVKHKKTVIHKVVRCKECFEIHKKGETVITIAFVVTFICSIGFLMDITNNSIVQSFFLSLISCIVIGSIIRFLIGTYFAMKYKTKPEWARGGFF